MSYDDDRSKILKIQNLEFKNVEKSLITIVVRI